MSRRFNDRTPIDIDKEIGKVKEMNIPELVNYIISTMERKRISSFEALRNDAFISPLGYVTELPKGANLLLFPFKGYFRREYSLDNLVNENGELVFYVSEELHTYNVRSTKCGTKRYMLDELFHLLDVTPWKKAYFHLKNDVHPWTRSKYFLLYQIISKLLHYNPQRAEADSEKITPLTDRELEILIKKNL